MMNETLCTVVGWVATPLREAFDKNGEPIASFRLGCTPRKWTREKGWHDGSASFYTVSCFRTLARNVLSSINKNDPVIVRGRLQISDWTRDGRTGTSAEITADSVGHDLQRGTSAFLWKRVAAAQPTAPEDDPAADSKRAVEEEPVDISPGRSDWTPPDAGDPYAGEGFRSHGTTLDPSTGELTTPPISGGSSYGESDSMSSASTTTEFDYEDGESGDSTWKATTEATG